MDPLPTAALAKAQELHGLLSIPVSEWHELKSKRERRAAEQLSAALVQLLSDPSSGEAEALLASALRWLQREQHDPGCPGHQRAS
ncbi:MAG: DUF6439 family protein [Synechococcus lacustris]|jgi:hypothetical protein